MESQNIATTLRTSRAICFLKGKYLKSITHSLYLFCLDGKKSKKIWSIPMQLEAKPGAMVHAYPLSCSSACSVDSVVVYIMEEAQLRICSSSQLFTIADLFLEARTRISEMSMPRSGFLLSVNSCTNLQSPLSFAGRNFKLKLCFEVLLSLLTAEFHFRESVQEGVLPGLPDDLALRCLAKSSHGYHGVIESVSKKWKDLVRSSEYANYKANQGWCGDWLFVVTERSNNQWIAYDREADRWHPLPKIPTEHDGLQHFGFSCVCVCNRLLVIGGSYAPRDTASPHQMPVITNAVMQFDPFKKQWTRLKSMQTPRSHFACCVISGKVYVVGGLNLSYPRGLSLAEVYDPISDGWEELPDMPNPQMDCLGISYKGKFHVLSDQVGLAEQNPSEIFDPSNKTWCTVNNIWPFSRAIQFAVQVMGDDQVYTVVDSGESLVKTRDSVQGEWYNVGAVPPVHLPDHSRELEAFGYGFAALRHELYVLGGKVLKWEDSGVGRFDVVRLAGVRVCDPLQRPLSWREIGPMCRPAGGSILGCVS
ncbi:LOW QUALITY PROTEIN: F-box/kelch-repeat protein At1g16250-like [Durio zibethinus]|uniref:LOW QUALITY PROTEIN: F-box/kelch-repeat protein At1g16250-like n=1 Tax=Durio zibethinus TaxID=66656 RepID=A0A6P5WVY2_DURZI|nr:LOW QUALITY PROTEIN: F-box/kelch-repeat protein At1g16250-like [Durio zibethinus]